MSPDTNKIKLGDEVSRTGHGIPLNLVVLTADLVGYSELVFRDVQSSISVLRQTRGILAESIALRGAQVLGIDLGEAPLAVARLHQLESGATLDYQRLAAEELAEREPASFDVVTCMEMLEHVPDPASTIRACARLAKPAGHVIFSTINRNPKSYLFVIIGVEYVLRMLPKGTHDYRKFIRPSELDGWARAAGLTVRELTGLHHNPLTGRYWLGPGVSVNYMAHCRPDAAS